ncbi:glycoside hydrolase superfamily [Russula brevipes]|nr:glycoside hydrolase superfamily [Russula brevipes]
MSLALYFLIIAQLAWGAPSCSLVSHASTDGISPLTPSHGSPRDIVAAAWYASWHSSDFTLEDVSWSKYSAVIYAFGTTTPDVNVIGLQDSDKQLLPQFVQMAHNHNVGAILSIGGWTGSRYFSSAVATAENRTAFANAVMSVVSQYKLDGIEFDWESPAKQGIGCNIMSSGDSADFLAFLQTLRAMKGAENLLLSAAVGIKPFIGSDGNPLSDVTAFAKVLDYIEIMNYDIWGSWSSSVGPNAPLNDTCSPSPQGSAVSAVRDWSNAGFPRNQTILAPSDALDSSGNVKLYPPFNKSQQPAGDKWDATAGGVDECGNANTVGGVFNFWGLIDGGFLTTDGTAASAIDHTFDDCGQTVRRLISS